MYQTVRYEIKEGHDMYRYCRQVCRSFKNMYNVTNFYIRQLLTGFNKLGLRRMSLCARRMSGMPSGMSQSF